MAEETSSARIYVKRPTSARLSRTLKRPMTAVTPITPIAAASSFLVRGALCLLQINRNVTADGADGADCRLSPEDP